jgi:hypothetical protein
MPGPYDFRLWRELRAATANLERKSGRYVVKTTSRFGDREPVKHLIVGSAVLASADAQRRHALIRDLTTPADPRGTPAPVNLLYGREDRGPTMLRLGQDKSRNVWRSADIGLMSDPWRKCANHERLDELALVGCSMVTQAASGRPPLP